MSYGIYKYPLMDLRQVRDLREMLNTSEELYGERAAFLIKDPVALREVEPKSEAAISYKPNPNDEYRSISFKQYASDVRAFGSYLKSLGIQSSDKVAIVSETRYEWYVSYLATVNGLAIVVPLDKNLGTDEILNNLERAQCNTIIYSKSTADKVEANLSEIDFVKNFINMDYVAEKGPEILEDNKHADLSAENNNPEQDSKNVHADIIAENDHPGHAEVYFWDALAEGYTIREQDKSYDELEIDPEEFRILLFTSGTTSKSKAVMLSHKNICGVVNGAPRMVDLTDCVSLSILPLHHTYESTCGFLIQIYLGNPIAIGDGLRHIVKNSAQAKVSILLLVPAILEAIYKTIQSKINADPKLAKKFSFGMKLTRFLRKFGIDIRKKVFKSVHDMFGGELTHIIIGGAAIEPEILDFFNDLGFIAIQGYGLTEASPIFALNRDKYYDSASAGLPIPTMEAKIINKDANGIGEIVGRGPSIMIGYYQDPERTAEAIDSEGFYHTGDYGYIDDRGFIFITGRKANIIVAKNGENVFPEEVEFVLDRNEIIKEVIVYGERDEKAEQIITAEVFPDTDYVKSVLGTTDLTAPEVRDAIDQAIKNSNKELNTQQKVRNFHIRTEPFPRNTSNKILRNRHQRNV